MNINWEEQLDRDLKDLPDLQAPPSLTRIVLERIGVPSHHTWQLTYFEWNRYQQIVFVVIALLLGIEFIHTGNQLVSLLSNLIPWSLFNVLHDALCAFGYATESQLSYLGEAFWKQIALFGICLYATGLCAGDLLCRALKKI